MTEKEYAWLAYLSRKNEIMCLRLIGQLENEQLRQEVRSIRGNFSLENLQRFGIIEKRGWVTIDGNHVLIEGEAAKRIKAAFKNNLGNKNSSAIVDVIIENHSGLADFTPEGMKAFLEECGYEVKPLGSSSSLHGLSFESGGGYRVSFGGDGYFQYHPKNASHHGKKPYWRVSNGKRGDNRYGMDGKEFQ